MAHDLSSIVKNFQIDGTYLDGGPYGTGHINETYAVRFQTGTGVVRYILQKINHNIFKNVPGLMENIQRVTSHLRSKIEAAGGDPDRETLNVIPTHDGKSFVQTDDGGYWRAYIFIEGAQTYDIAEKPVHIYNASYAFGRFQGMVADLPAPRLNETIPNFHHTPSRFKAFQEAVEKDEKGRAADVKDEIQFVLDREADAARLVKRQEAGELPERTTHNDTKLNNVMLDDNTDAAVCVIDLDTVMPGLVAYDFGDSIRIGASTGAEDEKDLSKVSMDLKLFEQLTKGYLDSARSFLTPAEIEELAFSAKLLTFECGTRFLTDHLMGDTYFRIHRENHNLDRCRTQFKMVADMEGMMERMQEIVQQHAKG